MEGSGHSRRYLAATGAQDGVGAGSRSLPPSALNASREVACLATVAVALGTNFPVYRHGIFYAKPAVPERDHDAPAFEGDSPAQTSVEQPTR